MDIISQLTADHRRVEELFEQVQVAAPEERRGLIDRIVAELSVHAALEENLLYPVIRVAVPNGDELVLEALADHQDAKEQLALLDKMTGIEDDFRDKIEELAADIDEHVGEEEETIFTLLRESLDEEALEQLGTSLEVLRPLAPTRPHPGAPNEGPAATLAAPVAAVIDKIRDLVERRQRA